MKRDAFLDNPEAWTRASRVMPNRVDYACAVERASVDRVGRVGDWMLLLAAVGIVIAIAVGVL